ncbi:hypothetical protein B0T19DRAFT_396897 [Cercophora scortea]|uniref:Uncharacterized protein n=1 Tax=Cercophora scortea TaxID=314031 RepID=A0AAE0J5C3_9PEZI|nr:hypothetical protein B0T19DRAFT_396897 [Cercophora scortea]
MATLTFDSELMTHHLAATPVPPSSHLVTVIDDKKAPMTFSVGNDKVLYLIRTGESGAHELVDFGSRLGYGPDAEFLHFGLSQSWDTTLYMALVVRESGGGSQKMIVTKGFKPSDLLVTGEGEQDVSSLIVPHEYDPKEANVVSVMVGNCGPEEEYPLVLVTFKVTGKIASTEDVARVNMESDQSSWALSSDVQLPENATEIYHLLPVTIDLDPGYVAVYRIQDKTSMVFIATEEHFDEVAHVPLPCSKGARVLATCLNKDGYNDLLVGGDELRHYKSKTVGRGRKGTRLTSDGVFSNSTQLFCSQSDHNNVTVWAANSRHGIGYATTSSAFAPGPSGSTIGSPVQLIPDGRGGKFAPFIDPVTNAQQLMVAAGDGSLSLLHQDTPGTGLWKRMPYATPVLDKTVNVESFFVHCTVQNEDGTTHAHARVLLQCSGYTTVYLNGRTIELGPGGVEVTTDARGSLGLVVPAPDVSSFTYLVRDVQGQDKTIFDGQVHVVISDKNLHDRLSRIKSEEDLKKEKLQSGELLLSRARGMTDRQLNEVAEAIQRLEAARTERLSKEMNASATSAGASSPTQAAAALVEVQRSTLLCGHNLGALVHACETAGGAKDMLWSMWDGIVDGVKSFTSWAVGEVGDVYQCVLEVEKDVYRWVINTAASVGKVLSAIFEKVLEIGLKDIVAWLATHRSIVHFVNSSADAAIGSVDVAEDEVSKFFDRAKEAVKKLAKFAFGGAGEFSILHGDPNVATDDDISVLNDVIIPIAESIRDTVKGVAKDLAKLFNQEETNLTVGQVLATIGVDIAAGVIDCLKKLTVGILKVVKSLIQTLRKYANFRIDVPIFSALYKKYVSGGTDLTILDLAALILAIPTTVVHKILTGKAPADLTGLDYKDLVSSAGDEGGVVSKAEYTVGVSNFLAIADLLATQFMGVCSSLGGLIPLGAGMEMMTAITPARDMPDSAAFISTFLSARALSRLHAPHPLRSMNTVEGRLLPGWGTKAGQTVAGKVWALVRDWRMIALAKLCLRGATIPVRDDPAEAGHPFRWLSWAGNCVGDALYVCVHLCADELQALDERVRGLSCELIVPLAVLSSAEAIYVFVMDVLVVGSLCDGIGSAGLSLSTVFANYAIIDPDEETSVVVTVGEYGCLTIGVLAKVAKIVYDHYDERYLRLVAKYTIPASMDAWLLFWSSQQHTVRLRKGNSS